MNKRFAIRPVLAALGCCLLCGAGAAPGAVVQVAVDSANPPFMSGTITAAHGVYPALLAAAFGAMGEPVLVAALPWKRVIVGIDEGRSGAAGIYRNAQRAKTYDFSEPLFVERIGVYYNTKNPVAFKSVADLYGMRVGVLTGWSYGDEFDRACREGKIIADPVPSDLQNLGKLEIGRIDVALIIVDAAPALLSLKPFQGIAKSERLLAEFPTYLAFNKRAGKTALLRKFNATLNDLRANGEHARIVARELAPPDH
jgi:polar amino acid transport system substrate-binding protein